MNVTELILLLSEVTGIGDKTIAAVLHRNALLRRTPGQFIALGADRWVEEYGFRRDAAVALDGVARSGLHGATTLAREMHKAGIRLLTVQDAASPNRHIESLEDPPPVIYAYGSLSLADAPLFAAANSNGAGEEALAATDRAAEAAIGCGWSPVTGHNRVPYQRPALVSRRNGGRVCYVLDRGMFEAFGGDMSRELFPAARIWSPAYDPDCDLTLSPFPLRAHGLAVHNRRRDELIFGIARVVFVGAVRPGGQMERACRQAVARGVAVLLVGPEAESDAEWIEFGARRVEPAQLASILDGVLGMGHNRTTPPSAAGQI
jgi:predicted Rossmann fold nucleotide-binding protein DprA/Smf involved in DNA uptake